LRLETEIERRGHGTSPSSPPAKPRRSSANPGREGRARGRRCPPAAPKRAEDQLISRVRPHPHTVPRIARSACESRRGRNPASAACQRRDHDCRRGIGACLACPGRVDRPRRPATARFFSRPISSSSCLVDCLRGEIRDTLRGEPRVLGPHRGRRGSMPAPGPSTAASTSGNRPRHPFVVLFPLPPAFPALGWLPGAGVRQRPPTSRQDLYRRRAAR